MAGRQAVELGGTRIYRMAWGWQILNTLLGFITHLSLYSQVAVFGLGGISLGAAAVVIGSVGCVLSPLLSLIGTNPNGSQGSLAHPLINSAGFGLICAGGLGLIGITILAALAGAVYLTLVAGQAVRRGPRSCLRLSDEGLEYRLWPFLAVKSRWENVRGLRVQRLFNVRTDLLQVKDAQVFGLPRLGVSETIQDFEISLNGLEGWPAGNLAEDLHRHAPQIGEKK